MFENNHSDPEGWSLGKLDNIREVLLKKDLSNSLGIFKNFSCNCNLIGFLHKVMGPNAWLWFVPVKTALGDGITFPTRIPLTECSTFHSIGESFTFSSLQLNAFKI